MKVDPDDAVHVTVDEAAGDLGEDAGHTGPASAC